jgi:hypothetical protein
MVNHDSGCRGSGNTHSVRIDMSHVRAAVNRRGADLNPSFDPWTLWLSSAAMFVGILVAGLIPW